MPRSLCKEVDSMIELFKEYRLLGGESVLGEYAILSKLHFELLNVSSQKELQVVGALRFS